MNKLLARYVSREGNSGYRFIFEGQQIFPMDFDFTHRRVYSPNDKLQNDEWFYLQNFMSQDYSIECVRDDFNTDGYDSLSEMDLNNVPYIFQVEDDMILFQKMTTAKVYRKPIISLEGEFSLKENPKIILINDIPDAIYKRDEDRLYFKELSTIKSIFTGLDAIYKEATNEEVETFLQIDLFSISEGFSATDVKTYNRSRIKRAKEVYDSFSDAEKNQLRVYIHTWRPTINQDGNKFNISSDNELRDIINCIEQRFYEAPINSEKRQVSAFSLE
ncbi:MAG: hypothetical protein MJZ84_06945 [Paludibacteraceae bacterium]|nr:hypothetical protein [Paludibacteraceae bacterium]